jgi:hypothetical protein
MRKPFPHHQGFNGRGYIGWHNSKALFRSPICPLTLFRPQAGKVFAQAEQFFFARRPLREGGWTGSRAPRMAGLPTKIRLLLF